MILVGALITLLAAAAAGPLRVIYRLGGMHPSAHHPHATAGAHRWSVPQAAPVSVALDADTQPIRRLSRA